MLPDWDGENIHISGDTVISRDFDFLSHMDIVGNLSNCWYTAWLQDFSSSGEVVQSNKISAFAIMPYNHQVQYGTTNAYVASDDTVSFDFSVKNYGLNDDNYDIWMESSFPGSWLVEIEGSGSSFDSSRIAIASGVEEDFSVNISPIGDIDNGSAMVYVRAVDDPEAVTDTIIFGAFSGGDILLISSIPANDDVIYYKDLLDDNDIQYVSWPKEDYGNPPDISDIDFDAIIWHDGINTSDPVSAEEKDAIRAYLENGGKMLISSSTFGQMSGMTYFMLVIGAMREGSESVPTGVTGLEPGTEFTGYTASLLGSYAEKIIPQSDARGVLRFTTGPFCALTKDFEGGGKLVYFSFKYEDIASETERDDLWDRIMEYWGDVSVQNLYTPNSHAIVDIYPNPFNGAVGISIDLPEENEVEIEIYDISGNLVDRISPGMLSASKSIVKWQPKGITSGIYLARVLFSGETIEKKLIYLK